MQQAADALLHIKTNCKDFQQSVNEVPFLIISSVSLARALSTTPAELDTILEPKGFFASLPPELRMMAGITENKKADIPTLSNFMIAQSTRFECRAVSASDGKSTPASASTVTTLIEFPIYLAYLSMSCSRHCASSLALCHYSLLAGYPGKCQVLCSREKQLYWTSFPMTSTLRPVIPAHLHSSAQVEGSKDSLNVFSWMSFLKTSLST